MSKTQGLVLLHCFFIAIQSFGLGFYVFALSDEPIWKPIFCAVMVALSTTYITYITKGFK